MMHGRKNIKKAYLIVALEEAQTSRNVQCVFHTRSLQSFRLWVNIL